MRTVADIARAAAVSAEYIAPAAIAHASVVASQHDEKRRIAGIYLRAAAPQSKTLK